jgi:hypothetical protein
MGGERSRTGERLFRVGRGPSRLGRTSSPFGTGLSPLGAGVSPFGVRRQHASGNTPTKGDLEKKVGAMTEAEAAAQEELRQIAEELDEICDCLMDLNQRLPVSPRETPMLRGEEEMDVATQVRSVIECVLIDRLSPATRDLAAAASFRPAGNRDE